jgi:hypothetical protein
MVQKSPTLAGCFGYMMAFIFIIILPESSIGQTYDVILKNRKLLTDSTMEFDVYIKNNNNSGDWGMRSYQSGYQFDSVFVNGGALSCRYIAGSSELDSSFNKVWGFSWNAANFIINQSANTGSRCPGAIINNQDRRIGTFRVTNSKKWGCAKDNISIVRSGSGFLKLAITKYNDIFCTILNAVDITANASVQYLSTNQNFETTGCSPYSWNGNTYTQSGIYYYSVSRCDIHNDTLNLILDTAFRWTGSISSEWENPLNWNCGSLPDSNSLVIIPSVAAFMPEVSSTTAVCRRIYFENKGRIIIKNKGKLSILER